jgi:anti-sigma-K factor RskA
MSGFPGTGGHDAFHEDAAAYVLGALTAEEHERFSGHLAACPECREEVARLQVAADALPLSTPQLSAPPELKRRVMEAVEEPQPGRRPVRREAARAPRRWAMGGVVALAAVAVVLAVVALASTGGSGSAPARVVRAQVQTRGASATLRIDGGRGELVVNGMPQVPPRGTYEVWVQRGAAPQPTDALFSVSGAGAATVAVPGSMAGVRRVLVTAEPLGGTTTPTSPPVIVARLD